jgi:SAM-dependent methyltransferase
VSPQPYSSDFFEGQATGSQGSARVVVPLVIDLISPASVVDVGCGVGGWLAEFISAGIHDAHGYDGDYVPRAMLTIPPDRFHAADLTTPLNLGRRFDLAISLEVGEHLPPPSSETFVATLCSAAPVVLFSAAIPLQGGTGHVNERWPEEWATLFAARGYRAVDALRPLIWHDQRVAVWYRQNLLLFASDPRLAAARARTSDTMLGIVHPRLFERRNRKPIRRFPRLARARAWLSGLSRTLRGKAQ